MSPKPCARNPVSMLLFAFFLLIHPVLLLPSVAEGAVCTRGNVPAATLLLPYFEVDTAAPGGQTTLFSVGNAAEEPTLAFVTVWSDWGIPVLGFYLLLAPQEVKTINLRDVVQARQIPSLETDPGAFPGCIDAPILLGSSVEHMHLQLTGQPDAESGSCFGRDRGETNLAVGFVTVDVADDCEELTSISQWVKEGLAGGANVLWGEIFYVDPDQDSARGRNAVPVREDSSVKLDGLPFYPNSLARVPLDEVWRTRFITGAGVDAETEIIMWSNEWWGLDQEESGRSCSPLGDTFGAVYQARVGPQSGPLGEILPFAAMDAVVRKFTLEEFLQGGEVREVPGNGVLEVRSLDCACLTIPSLDAAASVIWPIFKAEGRFSLALEATPIDGFCVEEP